MNLLGHAAGLFVRFALVIINPILFLALHGAANDDTSNNMVTREGFGGVVFLFILVPLCLLAFGLGWASIYLSHRDILAYRAMDEEEMVEAPVWRILILSGLLGITGLALFCAILEIFWRFFTTP